MLWRGEKSLPLPRTEPWFTSHPACSLITVLTELFWFLMMILLIIKNYMQILILQNPLHLSSWLPHLTQWLLPFFFLQLQPMCHYHLSSGPEQEQCTHTQPWNTPNTFTKNCQSLQRNPDLLRCCLGRLGTASGFPTNAPRSAIRYAKWRRRWVSITISLSEAATLNET
jgi:hypothetical protein